MALVFCEQGIVPSTSMVEGRRFRVEGLGFGLRDQGFGFQIPGLRFWGAEVGRETTLEVTQGQISIQSPTDATRFWWHLSGR